MLNGKLITFSISIAGVKQLKKINLNMFSLLFGINVMLLKLIVSSLNRIIFFCVSGTLPVPYKFLKL